MKPLRAAVVILSLASAASAEDFDRGRRLNEASIPAVGTARQVSPPVIRVRTEVMAKLVRVMLNVPGIPDVPTERNKETVRISRRLHGDFGGAHYIVTWYQCFKGGSLVECDPELGDFRIENLGYDGRRLGSWWYVVLKADGTVTRLFLGLHGAGSDIQVAPQDPELLSSGLNEILEGLLHDDH